MPKDNNKNKRSQQGSQQSVDQQGAKEFRDFIYGCPATGGKMKLIYQVDCQGRMVTFYAAEDRGDKLFQLSQKEIRTAKEVLEEMFRPDHSVDGHAGTICNSRGFRLDLQGYIAHKFGTRWANLAIQYGVRPKSGVSNTYAQVMIPVPSLEGGSNGFVDYPHDVRLKALKLSLEHSRAIWVRTLPASVEELRCPVRDDFQQSSGGKPQQTLPGKRAQ